MLSKFLKVFVVAILFMSVTHESACAREIIRTDVETLLLRMQSVLNRKNPREISRFFKFYSESTARFLMKNQLVDPDSTNKILATEELNMTWDQYVKYLENIIKPNYVYLFKIKMTDFQYNEEAELATVSFHLQEYALQVQYDGKRKVDDITTLGSTNCNLHVGENATDLEILSMNCISKIVRK